MAFMQNRSAYAASKYNIDVYMYICMHNTYAYIYIYIYWLLNISENAPIVCKVRNFATLMDHLATASELVLHMFLGRAICFL